MPSATPITISNYELNTIQVHTNQLLYHNNNNQLYIMAITNYLSPQYLRYKLAKLLHHTPLIKLDNSNDAVQSSNDTYNNDIYMTGDVQGGINAVHRLNQHNNDIEAIQPDDGDDDSSGVGELMNDLMHDTVTIDELHRWVQQHDNHQIDNDIDIDDRDSTVDENIQDYGE